MIHRKPHDAMKLQLRSGYQSENEVPIWGATEIKQEREDGQRNTHIVFFTATSSKV